MLVCACLATLFGGAIAFAEGAPLPMQNPGGLGATPWQRGWPYREEWPTRWAAPFI